MWSTRSTALALVILLTSVALAGQSREDTGGAAKEASPRPPVAREGSTSGLRLIATPRLSFTAPDVALPFCDETVAVSFSIDNTGDGPAIASRLQVDLSPLTVVASSAPYALGAFSLPDLPAGGRVTLEATLGLAAPCGIAEAPRDLVWRPEYRDASGILFSHPVALSRLEVLTGRPDLTVSVAGVPATAAIGGQVALTVASSLSGALSCGAGSSGEITVAMTVPDGFTVVDPGGGVWVPGSGGAGGTLAWSYLPPASLAAAVVLQTPDASQCTLLCGITPTLAVTASGTDCCGCALSAASSERVALTCAERMTASRSAVPVPTESCTTLDYFTDFNFATDASLLLNDLVFEDHADHGQSYVPGSLTVLVDGSDITGCVVVTDTTPGGPLLLDLSGCAATPVAGTHLSLGYRLALGSDSAPSCSGERFHSWSTLSLPPEGTGCLADGELHQAALVAVEAPAMALTVTGFDGVVEACGTRTVTLTLEQTSLAAAPHDVRLVLSGTDVAAANPFATVCAGMVSPHSCPPTIVGDGDLWWSFGDGFTGGGQEAEITLDLVPRCPTPGALEAHVVFDDRCHDDGASDETCAVSIVAVPAASVAGELLLQSTPAVVTAGSATVEWRLELTNVGAGTVRNLWLDEILGSDLSLVGAVVDGPPGATVTLGMDHSGAAINGFTVSVAELAPGDSRTVTVQAALLGCDVLTADAVASFGCLGVNCRAPVLARTTVEAPAPELTTTLSLTSPVATCGSTTAALRIDNAGPSDATDLRPTLSLSSGMLYTAGSTRWRVDGGPWNGPDPAYDPSPTSSPLRWTSAEIPALAHLPAGGSFEIEVELGVWCDATGGTANAETSFASPCGERLVATADPVGVAVTGPELRVAVSRGDAPVGCRELLEWQIAVENLGSVTAPVVWVEAVLDSAFSLESWIGDPAYAADNGTATLNTVAWELVGLGPGATANLLVRATTDTVPCSPDLDVRATASWGCGAADGLSTTKPGDPGAESSLCLSPTAASAIRTETRQPALALAGFAQTPLSGVDGATTLTVVFANTGPTESLAFDLEVVLPPGLSYVAGSSRACVGVDASCVPVSVTDPAIAGARLTYYDRLNTASNLADIVQASGGDDTLMLVFDVAASCYAPADLTLDLYVFDCCEDTQHHLQAQRPVPATWPRLELVQLAAGGPVSCTAADQTATLTVRNTGDEVAPVVRVEATPGDWLAVDPAAATPPATAIPGTGFGWELGALAPGDSVLLSVPVAVAPAAYPDQADCSTALRRLSARAVWGAGSGPDATDGDPTTTLYDCTHPVWTVAPDAVVPMPDLAVGSLTPAVTCLDDGSLSGSLTLRLDNLGDGDAAGPFVVQVSDDRGWTGAATFAGALGRGTSAELTVDTTGWSPVCHGCADGYAFTATVDTTGAVCECREDDNTTGSTPFTVPVANPQLTAALLTVACTAEGVAVVRGDLGLGNGSCGPLTAVDLPIRFTLLDAAGGSGALLDRWTETFPGVSLAPEGALSLAIEPRAVATSLCGPAAVPLLSILAEIDPENVVCECSGADNERLADERPLSGETCSTSPRLLLAPPITLADSTAGREDSLDWGVSCPVGTARADSGLGPEVVYRLEASGPCSGTVTLTPEGWDAALWWLQDGSCSEPPTSGCAGADSGGAGEPETLAVTLDPAVDSLLVVDGSGGGSGPFTLTLDLTGCTLVPVELQSFSVSCP